MKITIKTILLTLIILLAVSLAYYTYQYYYGFTGDYSETYSTISQAEISSLYRHVYFAKKSEMEWANGRGIHVDNKLKKLIISFALRIENREDNDSDNGNINFFPASQLSQRVQQEYLKKYPSKYKGKPYESIQTRYYNYAPDGPEGYGLHVETLKSDVNLDLEIWLSRSKVSWRWDGAN